jgi:ATP-dependent DNA helicase RecQ
MPHCYRLNVFEIGKKKERDLGKARAVARYASHEHLCRTLLLLEYFNEFDAQECGVCDNCIKNRRTENQNYTGLNEAITNYLNEGGPVTPLSLSQAFENVAEADFLKALQELIEEEVIRYDPIGKLFLTNKTQH